MARLETITGKAISGEWGVDDEFGTRIPVLRTTNFTNDGVINFTNVVTRTIAKKDLSEKYLRLGDIIIEKSGGSDKQPVGRVVYYSGKPNTYLFNNFTGVLRVIDSSCWDSKYLFYALYANYLKGGTRKYQNKTTGLHNLKTDQYIKEFEVPERPIQEQKQISIIFDRLCELISLRKQQLAKLDELVKARFVEMFGVYPYNEKGWKTCTIKDIVSDVRYGTSRPAVDGGTYPYLRMNNITYGGQLDLSDVKRIDIPENELSKCTVKRGDVLFNRTNSKELVGKTCVYDKDEMMVLAGFIIRVRVNEQTLPEFLSSFLNADFSKKMLLGMCKTAIGQANINAQELQGIELYLPPIMLQQEFVVFKTEVSRQKLTIQQSLDKLDVLKTALMQEYFG